jgi:hypothetical protein
LAHRFAQHTFADIPLKSRVVSRPDSKPTSEGKKLQSEIDDELRPEYDLRELLEGAVRGKYAERYRAGTNLVLLDPDVAKAFPNEQAVNEALRLVLQLMEIPEVRKRTAKA